MPLPPKASRIVRRHLLPLLALVHLSGYHLFRAWVIPPVHGGKWILSAILATGMLLLRESIPTRRKDRLPDLRSIVAWTATSALELHAALPLLAESRIVPAFLFPLIASLLDLPTALAYGILSLAWLSWVPGMPGILHRVSVSMSAMAILGMAAGMAFRRVSEDGRIAGEGGRPVRPAFLREPSEPEARRETGEGIARETLLEDQERRIRDGIRRILEGILPASGADLVIFASRSERPGRPFRAAASARKGEGGEVEGTEIPDGYLPLREAVLFRRSFFGNALDAPMYRLPGIHSGRDGSGIAAVPVLVEGSAEGVLFGFRFGAGPWAEPVIPLLETGAFLIAREISEGQRRYQAERALASRDGYYRFFHRVAELAERGGGDLPGVESPGELPAARREIYRVSVEETLRQLQADRVLLIEADERGSKGRIVREEKRPGRLIPDDSSSPGPWVRLDGTYAKWVLDKGMHRILPGGVRGTGGHPVLPADWEEEGKDYLLVPASGMGGFRGVLVCASAIGRNFHAQDVEAVRDVLRIMRMGISHAATLEMLERQATTDGLTGLLNRKTFQRVFSTVLERLDGRHPCALIMLDIDHFKRINDTYGHPAGDEVLRRVSEVIAKTVRKMDIAGRYGGEEFILYLDRADRRRADGIAERLRMIIEKSRIVLPEAEIRVTASIGVSCYPDDGRSVEELVGRADEALYRSKQGGRNRVTFA
ncbi:MAG: hypothetical protein Kow00128_11350 [Deltaproteobacteria bacterium]